MIRVWVTLGLFSKMCMTETDLITQPNPLLTVEIGASATLECFVGQDETEYTFWFKQSVGEKPYLIAASHKYSSEAVFYNNFNSTRLKVQTDVGINHLIFSETVQMDSAMYYCGVLKNYQMIFGEGTFLGIKGEPQKFESWTVVQQPVSESILPGDSVTLQCTVDSGICAGEHSVYWFRRSSGESLPGLIYTHGNRNVEAVSPTQSCVYSLPKRNLSHSDAGTYYCAVATCGEILFGNGTKLDIDGTKVDFLIIHTLGAALFLSMIVIAVLVCTRNTKICCEHCTEHTSQKAPNNTVQVEGSHDENHDEKILHYAALHFATKNPKTPCGRQKMELKEHSVYSEVIC